MMRSIISLLVSVLCCIFYSCSSPSTSQEENNRIKVLSTTAMIDDLVGQIGGEWIQHIVLISGELDPHSYELVKGDDEKIGSAQLVIANGLGLEHGASLRYWLEKHPFALKVGDEIQKKYPQFILEVEGEKDPHVWMDIHLWSQAIDPIVAALSVIDPEHASFYREKGAEVYQTMQETHSKVLRELQAIPSELRFLVTSHDAFNYFTKVYLAEGQEEDWKKRFAAPEGLAPDGQLSTADIQRIIDHLYLYKIGVVFPESNVSKDSLRKIVSCCRDLGHRVEVCKEALYGDAMGGKGSGADTYLKMMEYNVSVLLRNWKGEQ